MKITLQHPEFRYLHFNGKFYDTEKEIDVTFDEAIRLSQHFRVLNHDFIKGVYDPSLWEKNKEFAFIGDVDLVSGWGNVSYNLLKHSRNLNPAWVGKKLGAHDIFLHDLGTRELKPEMAVVYHDQPKSYWNQSPFGRKIAIVPFETTKIPTTWVSILNACDGLMVPCQQNVTMMKDSGIKIPIEVIHWGVDPAKHYELQRPESNVFTFGTMGALSVRKGTDILVEAFKRAFPTEQDVKLICKTSFRQYPFLDKDKRIEVMMDAIPHDELIRDFYMRVNCFVFPTRGEGFGLPPLEAMATGIPAIVTNWSGPVDYMNKEVGFPLDYKMVKATDFDTKVYKEDCGDWAEPDINQLVEIMRYCYNNRDKVKEMGHNAAIYVKENWTWEKKAQMFHEALDKFL